MILRCSILFLLVLPVALRAEDPVFERYKPGWFSGPVKEEFDMKFPAPTGTGTEADVKAGRAIFTLDGLGEHRVWNLPDIPTFAEWPAGKPFAERTCGYVCQAEEILVGGEWRRYFGFASKKGCAVLKAEEVDLWPTDPGRPDASWIHCSGGLDLSCENPQASQYRREGKARALAPEELPPIHFLARNRRGVSRAIPGDLHRALPGGLHSFRKGIAIRLKWAPFDPKRVVERYPADEDYQELPATWTAHEADPEKKDGPVLKSCEEVEAWTIDLREIFKIEKPGYYTYWLEVEGSALGLCQENEKIGNVFESFEIGPKPADKTVKELNEEMGALGSPEAEGRLRSLIKESFATPPADTPGAPALPADFPAFTREGYGFENGSGEESAVLGLLCADTNSDLMKRLKSYSASSVCAEFEKRMVQEDASPALRLIYASEAAAAGSRRAALEILTAMKSTDLETAKNVHSTLANLVFHFGTGTPEWLGQLVIAALSDDRFVTDPKDDEQRGSWIPRVSDLADDEAMLSRDIAEAKYLKAVPTLIARMRKNPRGHGAWALGLMGDAGAIPPLLAEFRKFLTDPEKNYQEIDSLLQGLWMLKAKESVPLILDHLDMRRAVEALDYIGDPSALPALRGMVENNGGFPKAGKIVHDDHDAERLTDARIALATLEPGDPVPRLTLLLRDGSIDDYKRSDVARRFGEHPDPAAVTVLRDALRDDPSGHVTLSCIQALGSFRCAEAVDALVECLSMKLKKTTIFRGEDGQEVFMDWASQGLKKITGQDLGKDSAAWTAWWKAHRDGFKPGK